MADREQDKQENKGITKKVGAAFERDRVLGDAFHGFIDGALVRPSRPARRTTFSRQAGFGGFLTMGFGAAAGICLTIGAVNGPNTTERHIYDPVVAHSQNEIGEGQLDLATPEMGYSAVRMPSNDYILMEENGTYLLFGKGDSRFMTSSFGAGTQYSLVENQLEAFEVVRSVAQGFQNIADTIEDPAAPRLEVVPTLQDSETLSTAYERYDDMIIYMSGNGPATLQGQDLGTTYQNLANQWASAAVQIETGVYGPTEEQLNALQERGYTTEVKEYMNGATVGGIQLLALNALILGVAGSIGSAARLVTNSANRRNRRRRQM